MCRLYATKLKKEINFLSHACSAPIDCTVLMHKLHVFKDHLLVVWSEWVARVLLAILINRCRFTSLCVILPTQRFNWLLTLGFMITWSSYQKNKNKRKKRESDPPVSHSTSHLNQTPPVLQNRCCCPAFHWDCFSNASVCCVSLFFSVLFL